MSSTTKICFHVVLTTKSNTSANLIVISCVDYRYRTASREDIAEFTVNFVLESAWQPGLSQSTDQLGK